MDRFTQRMHALPPELFEKIYILTFTAEPTTHKIDPQYKPPKLLAIDPASRKLFADSYYGRGSTFVAEEGIYLADWLEAVSPDHQRCLEDIAVPYPKYPEISSLEMRREVVAQFQLIYEDLVQASAPSARKECVHVGIEFNGVWVWRYDHSMTEVLQRLREHWGRQN